MADTYFDEAAANKVVNFLEKILIPPEVGHHCELPPWLKEAIRFCYGTKNTKDGTRTVRTIYFFVPKKNAKSFILSSLALFHLCADGEQAADCISVAGTARQAGIVFEASKAMVKSSPRLSGMKDGRAVSKPIIEPFKLSLIHSKSSSKYSVIPADAETAEGPKHSFIGFDELHVQPTRKLWDSLRGSGLSRKQPMTVVATTAGHDKHSIAFEVHDYACRVRDGKIVDPTFYPVIYGATDDDDVHDPEVWKKCNPSYGITFNENDFRKLYLEAKEAGPARFTSWRRYHLNIWADNVTAWLPMDRWKVCGEKLIRPLDLQGRLCFPGADFSSVTDLTSVALLFPSGDGYDVLIYHWMPRANVVEAEMRDRVPYREWAKMGYLELTEGSAIDQQHILRRVIELSQHFPFYQKQIRLDGYNATQFIQGAQLEGFTPVPVSPTAKGISPPSKELLRQVVSGTLHHGDNPLLNWQAEICSVVEDAENNIRPFKGKGELRKRIDGILGICYALSGAMVHAPKVASEQTDECVYSKRGVLVI
jgi:phage terminase large subunit-like protein